MEKKTKEKKKRKVLRTEREEKTKTHLKRELRNGIEQHIKNGTFNLPTSCTVGNLHAREPNVLRAVSIAGVFVAGLVTTVGGLC